MKNIFNTVLCLGLIIIYPLFHVFGTDGDISLQDNYISKQVQTSLEFLEKKALNNMTSLKSSQENLTPDIVKIYWIRHGRIIDVEHTKRFLPDENLILREDTYEKIKNSFHFFPVLKTKFLYCSALTRSIQTAEAIIKFHGGEEYNYKIDTRLNEFFPNELIGLTIDEAEQRYGKNFFQNYSDNPLTNNYFKDSEKVEEAYIRILGFIKDLINSDNQSEYCLVGHGTLHNIFTTGLVKGDFSKIFSNFNLDYLNYSIFLYDKKKDTFTIHSINNLS